MEHISSQSPPQLSVDPSSDLLNPSSEIMKSLLSQWVSNDDVYRGILQSINDHAEHAKNRHKRKRSPKGVGVMDIDGEALMVDASIDKENSNSNVLHGSPQRSSPSSPTAATSSPHREQHPEIATDDHYVTMSDSPTTLSNDIMLAGGPEDKQLLLLGTVTTHTCVSSLNDKNPKSPLPRSPRKRRGLEGAASPTNSPPACHTPPRSPRTPNSNNAKNTANLTGSSSSSCGGGSSNSSSSSSSCSSQSPPPLKSLKTGSLTDESNPGLLSPTSLRRRQNSFVLPTATPPPHMGGPQPGGSWAAVRNMCSQVFDGAGGGTHGVGVDDNAWRELVVNVCGFPVFFSKVVFARCLEVLGRGSDQDSNRISLNGFERYYKQWLEPYDSADRFYFLVRKLPAIGSSSTPPLGITREDFIPLLSSLLSSHPGLDFLANHDEFQEKYAITVITRIFYQVDDRDQGVITRGMCRRGGVADAFKKVEEEEDINKVTEFFSYEHFYVLYCRFWELDTDRDYQISRDDLLKYGDHSLSHVIVDRIFDAAPRPFGGKSGGFMAYEDFIYFMLSEEDKANERSVRYWFRCLDLDGDNVLKTMELRHFYSEQQNRLACLGHEVVPFADMLCQMLDMIKPKDFSSLVVSDFLQVHCARVSGSLFDALFNLNKSLQFEQRDPFMERQKREDSFNSDWDRFAFMDYNRLALEEEGREDEDMDIDFGEEGDIAY